MSAWGLGVFPIGKGRSCSGSIWGRWGIAHARGRRYIVYLIDRARLTEFDSLRCARRFCEEIDGLGDWSNSGVKDDRALALACHRVALLVTGGRPELRVVDFSRRSG